MLVQFAKASRPTYHLQANDTTANDGHFRWHLLEVDGAGARDDFLLVDCQAGKRGSLRAGGNNDVLSADSGLTAIDQVDSNSVLVLERSSTLDVFDIVLLEEELDALGQAGHGRVLCLHHGGEVELDIAHLNAAALCVVEDLVVEVGVVKERLGGNAADVEAGPAEGAALLNACDLWNNMSS